MSLEGDNVPGGNNLENPGGNPDPKPSDDSVAFSTHQKLLSEKKKIASDKAALEEEVNVFKKKEKDAEISRLESEGNYKEALKLKEQELDAEKTKYTVLNKTVSDGKKLSSFLAAVNGDVSSKYWGLIDLDSISVDDNGTIDKDSINKAVASFCEQYGNEIIAKPNNANLPPGAPPLETTGSISYANWLKLPTKEMRARQKDVIKT